MSQKKYKNVLMVEDIPARGNREAKSYWTKIGVAFENQDGSFVVDLNAFPMTGRLVLKDPLTREDAGALQ